MITSLSFKKRESFVGEVFPVLLEGDGLRHADIRWTLNGARALMRGFSEERGGFSDGILVTPLEEGVISVTAELSGECYTSEISVRPLKRAEGGRLNYYIADLHCHTSMIHDCELYSRDGEASQRDYIAFLKDEGKMDLSVISDHADVIDARAFFRGFAEAEKEKDMRTVILPGAESEITLIENDRFGYPHKNSGEIVTLNSDNFASVRNHGEFFERLSTSPYAICILAHPQIIGFDRNGIWNFSLDKHREDGFDRLIKLIEIGNGTDRESNILNEFVYSFALDNGFRVSTTCSSDNHEAPWGVKGFPGKTVVMAPERSKEAFIDALLSGRCYCCESGNVKLYCEINGKPLPADLDPATEYTVVAEIDYFEDIPDTHPVTCEIVTDYGKVAAEVDATGKKRLEIRIRDGRARWFYLRLRDAEGRKTLSPPAYTGRAYDTAVVGEPQYLDKSRMTAKDLISGADASALINGNPDEPWKTELGRADVLIDLGEEREVSALAHYPWRIFRWAGVEASVNFAALVSDYEISLSQNGEDFTKVAEGAIRIYGGEVLIRFERQRARYLRFIAKSNVGAACRIKKYDNCPLVIGELSPAII